MVCGGSDPAGGIGWWVGIYHNTGVAVNIRGFTGAVHGQLAVLWWNDALGLAGGERALGG
jgi:hypothetical protein